MNIAVLSLAFMVIVAEPIVWSPDVWFPEIVLPGETDEKGTCKILNSSRIDIMTSGSLTNVVSYVAWMYGVKISIEEPPEWHVGNSWGNTWPRLPDISVNLKGATLEDVLNHITQVEEQRLTWRAWKCKYINIMPSLAHSSPDYVLNADMQPMILYAVNAGEAMAVLLERLEERKFWVSPVVLSPGQYVSSYEKMRRKRAPEKFFTLFAPEGTVRDALNAIFVIGGDEFSWRLSSLLDVKVVCVNSANCTDRERMGYIRNSIGVTRNHFYYRSQSKKTNVKRRKIGTRFEPIRMTKKTGKMKSKKKQLNIIERRIELVIRDLAKIYNKSITFESVLLRCDEKRKKCINDERVTITGEFTIEQAVQTMLRQTERYECFIGVDGIFHVVPRIDVIDSNYLLNQEVEYCTIEETQGEWMNMKCRTGVGYLDFKAKTGKDENLINVVFEMTGVNKVDFLSMGKRPTLRNLLSRSIIGEGSGLTWSFCRRVLFSKDMRQITTEEFWRGIPVEYNLEF